MSTNVPPPIYDPLSWDVKQNIFEFTGAVKEVKWSEPGPLLNVPFTKLRVILSQAFPAKQSVCFLIISHRKPSNGWRKFTQTPS